VGCPREVSERDATGRAQAEECLRLARKLEDKRIPILWGALNVLAVADPSSSHYVYRRWADIRQDAATSRGSLKGASSTSGEELPGQYRSRIHEPASDARPSPCHAPRRCAHAVCMASTGARSPINFSSRSARCLQGSPEDPEHHLGISLYFG
jgi:hypothetical protein